MSKDQVKVGQKVAVNKASDGIVYTVESVEGFTAKLSYMAGDQKVSGGEIDISCLREPTKAQLKNAGL